ncbi:MULTISPECIES: hypothetical protein [unclassified Bradyrhizobium]
MSAQANTGRFNPAKTSIKAMPNIEITEECRALIESAVEPPTGRRLPNGNWVIPVNEATWERLQQARRQGETISDCIIRLMIVTLHKYGLQ